MTKLMWVFAFSLVLYSIFANAKEVGKQVEAPEAKAGTYQISCYAADRNGWGLSAWCFKVNTKTGQVIKLDPDKIPLE